MCDLGMFRSGENKLHWTLKITTLSNFVVKLQELLA